MAAVCGLTASLQAVRGVRARSRVHAGKTSSSRLRSARASPVLPAPVRAGALSITSSRSVACHAAAESPASPYPLLKDGLIFASGAEGAWDSAGLGAPVVRCYIGDNEERWMMWYSGRAESDPNVDALMPGSGSVGVAVSKDGISWTRGQEKVEGLQGPGAQNDVGMIMGPNPEDWWTLDTCHLSVGDVQILSNGNVSDGIGVYWMFYSGGDFEEKEGPKGVQGVEEGKAVPGLKIRPGLAMSQDGRNWARIEADHYSHALFDTGDEGEWDEHLVGSPQVVSTGKQMNMYYHSFDEEEQQWVVGLATSENGFKWQKQGPMFRGGDAPDAFDAKGVRARNVVPDADNRQYVMFYEAIAADDTHSIGMAVSKDGVSNWQRYDKPIFTASEVGWDAGSVGSPSAVSMAAGKWRLYYAGRETEAAGVAWDGFGLALSDNDSPKFCGLPTAYKRYDDDRA